MTRSRSFSKKSSLLIAFVLPALFAAGCGGGSTSSNFSPASSATPRATEVGKPAFTPRPTAPVQPISFPQGTLVKVACVGDSITYGTGTSNRQKRSYPTVLGQLLGKEYNVANFGANGSTLLSSGWKPYKQQPEFALALKFKPDVVIVQLGTNDSRNSFTSRTSLQFETDYKTLIAAFQKVNPSARVYLCLPIPSYPQGATQNRTLGASILPLIEETAQETNSPLIDLNTPFSEHPELYTDPLHPNDEGARRLASTVYARLKATIVIK